MPHPPRLASTLLFSALCLGLAALGGRAPGGPSTLHSPRDCLPIDAGPPVQQVVIDGAFHAAPACAGAGTLWVADWRGPHLGRPFAAPGRVVAYDGPAATIEDFFARHGRLWVDGVGYGLSDGIFGSLHGVRAWVAVRPRPGGAAPVALRVVLFERDGALYYGGLQEAAHTARSATP